MKKCTKCGELKPKSDFRFQNLSKGYLYPSCKQCCKVYYNKNKDKLIKYGAEWVQTWRLQNPEENRRRRHAYHLKNKDKIVKKVKAHKENNKEHYTRYNMMNREKTLETQQKWREQNKDYQAKYYKSEKGGHIKRAWIANRRHSDPKFKLDSHISSQIGLALKGTKKGRHWEDLVGYTLEELVQHLESQFEDWMNLKNHGKWHIDHIVPKSHFHYTKPEDSEFKECWALRNLQPLEAKENLKKGSML
jgi:hypothetical protein